MFLGSGKLGHRACECLDLVHRCNLSRLTRRHEGALGDFGAAPVPAAYSLLRQPGGKGVARNAPKTAESEELANSR